MSAYEPLELPPRPDMLSPEYLAAVQRAADELRRAQPWLLIPYKAGDWRVARSRTVPMAVVTWLVNLWRRPRRWWLGRLQLAYEARQRKRGVT